MPQDNDWLWEVEDEPLGGGLDVEEPGPADVKKIAFDSESVVKAIRLHLAHRSDDALKELEKAKAKGEHLDEVYAVLGHVLFEKQRYKEAADAFSKLVDETPRRITGNYNLGVALYRLGDREGAMKAFERSLNVNSKRVEARLGLGLCLINAGNFAAALDHFTAYRQRCIEELGA